MLTIGREISISSIEDLYKKLDSQRRKNYVDLSIPMNPKFIGFGALSSLFQFFGTWRRLNNCGRLIINSKVASEISGEGIEASVKQYYGFLASVLAWDKGIITKNGKDIRNQFKKPNSEYANLLQSGEFEKSARGDSVLFPFFDHLDINRGLLPIVYRNGVLQDEKEFDNLTERIIEITTKNNSVLKKNFRSLKVHINGILYELFDNTNKWAKHSFTGKALNPNVRGIYGKFYKLELKNVRAYTNSTGLRKYFKKIQENNVSQEEYIKYVAFMELSVFDSGPGLAPKYDGRDIQEMTLEEEYSILLKCLKKHTTSHKEFGDFESRGLGLHRIMGLLDKKGGFLKIRSGRMLLYRDFITHPLYSKGQDSPNYGLLDWEMDGTKPTNRPKAEGTLITILIPVALTGKLLT